MLHAYANAYRLSPIAKKIRRESEHKPGSVLSSTDIEATTVNFEGGYLSGTAVTRRLKRLLIAELEKDQP